MLKIGTRLFLAPALAAPAVFAVVSPSDAAWLFYHKPAFEGRILDGESGGPIEGAVVVVVHYKLTFGIPGPDTGVIHVKETVTDKDGRFRIPSYTTLISPFAWSHQVRFTVFKPGYASLDGFPLEDVFTNNEHKFPEIPWMGEKDLKLTFRPGEAILPRITKEKDFSFSRSLIGAPVRDEQVPLLRKKTMDDRMPPWIIRGR